MVASTVVPRVQNVTLLFLALMAATQVVNVAGMRMQNEVPFNKDKAKRPGQDSPKSVLDKISSRPSDKISFPFPTGTINFPNGCVPLDGINGEKSGATGCPEVDGWRKVEQEVDSPVLGKLSFIFCCKGGAYITCKDSMRSWCGSRSKDLKWGTSSPSWNYLGNFRCCTTDWATCSARDPWMCKGNGYEYLGNRLCCLMAGSRSLLTCHKGLDSLVKEDEHPHCRPPWKLVGSKCCTTDYAHCEEDFVSDYCEGGGWMRVGQSKCCTTFSNHQQEVQCFNRSHVGNCETWGGKYLGRHKCCAASQGKYLGHYLEFLESKSWFNA